MYQVPDQTGRRIVVTGGNSGTGKETVRRLAAAGGDVILAARTPRKGEEARREIMKTVPKARIEVRHLDLADLLNVRAFAASLIAEGGGLDTLVNNAGVMTPPTRQATKDGHELQFGTNFLGPFALTNLLLPLLLRAPAPRVATMTSSAAVGASINWDDPDWQNGYSAFKAYGQSKLADLVMGLHLATLARRNGWPLLSTNAHPGYTRTNLQASGPNLGTDKTSMPFYMRLFPSMAPTQGAEPILHAAAAPDATPGIFYGPRWLLVGDTHQAKLPGSVAKVDAERLWSLAERMTGVTAPR